MGRIPLGKTLPCLRGGKKEQLQDRMKQERLGFWLETLPDRPLH